MTKTHSLTLTIILWFLTIVNVSGQESESQKHYFGVNAGLDPFNILKITLKSALNNNQEYDTYDNDEDESFGAFTLGFYYKYKPFKKIDFDGGYKINFSSLGDLNRSDDGFDYSYKSIADHLLYTRINYNLKNIHQEGEGNFSFSFEIGSLWTPSKLNIKDKQSEDIKSIKIRGSQLLYEFKVGYKYGLQNGALGVNIGINNAPYKKATLNDIEKRGFYSAKLGGPAILIGFDYEFGFKRNPEKVKQKKRKRRNRKIIEKHGGKTDSLFY